MREGFEERLVALELRYTAQQDELEALSGVVYEQQREIARLQAELRAARELLSSAHSQEEGPMPHEKPPHY